jgi:hypothetical protein
MQKASATLPRSKRSNRRMSPKVRSYQTFRRVQRQCLSSIPVPCGYSCLMANTLVATITMYAQGLWTRLILNVSLHFHTSGDCSTGKGEAEIPRTTMIQYSGMSGYHGQEKKPLTHHQRSLYLISDSGQPYPAKSA